MQKQLADIYSILTGANAPAMSEIGIADNRRVQGLGAQQRAALLEQLGS